MDMVRDFSVTPFQSTLPTRGSDEYLWEHTSTRTYFNPRSPRGGATSASFPHACTVKFQSTLPTRGSDYTYLHGKQIDKTISIHAPHEGGATMDRRGWHTDLLNFNPRSPRGGATKVFFIGGQSGAGFQSTLPTRGSDGREYSIKSTDNHFNPRSPRGGATWRLGGRSGCLKFQSTLPTRGSDIIAVPKTSARIEFQSTLPTRGSDATGKNI